MNIENRERHTIMSGKVVTYATGFREEPGVFGATHVATGPFEVSASRDAVIVHRAECRTGEDVSALLVALNSARNIARGLSRSDRGAFIWPPPSENERQ